MNTPINQFIDIQNGSVTWINGLETDHMDQRIETDHMDQRKTDRNGSFRLRPLV